MNKDILAEYYTENFKRLVSNVAMRIGDEETARDIVQDAFTNILSRTETIIPSTVSCLVWTVVGRLVCDYWRRKKPQSDYKQLVLAADGETNADPLTICSAGDVEEWLERGLARLSNAQSVVYRMNVYDDMKVSKIAETLDANYKTVEQRLGQARKLMRSYMKRVLAAV